MKTYLNAKDTIGNSRLLESLADRNSNNRSQALWKTLQPIFFLFLGIALIAFMFVISTLDITKSPTIRYFSPGITVRCENQVCDTYFSPEISVGLTGSVTRDDYLRLVTKMSLIPDWHWEIPLGSVTLYSTYSNQGLDYGGVYLIGPLIGIKYVASGITQSSWNRYPLMTIDNRD